jgi:hypothetical protein
MRATIKLVALTALRDRLFAGLFGILGVTIALSIFLGGAAVSEKYQLALVFAAGAGRFVIVLGLTVFAASHIQGLIETREVEAILARAVSRTKFVVSYWVGLSLLAIVLAGAFGLLIVFFAGETVGAFVWLGTLIAECVIIVAVSVFAGLMLERVTPAVLFTLGFYALARLMGFFIGIREAVDRTFYMNIVQRLMDFIVLFVPRLDLFAQTRWLVYGKVDSAGPFVALEVPLFLAIVLGAAVFDLRRKQF